MVQNIKSRKKTYAFAVNQSLQRRQEYTGGKESLLINVGKIRQLYTKNKTGPFSYTMCKTRIKID